MGILRVFFALIVLIGHAPPSDHLQPIFTGTLAVEAFFIISGFYIQLILAKYMDKPNGIVKFYGSRLTRIFSIYYLVLIITITFRISIGNYPLINLFHEGNSLSIFYSLFINIFLFGQDIARLVSFDQITGAVHFNAMGNYTRNEIPFGGFEIVQQAWTLAPELLFYLFSPFLLKTRTATLVALAVCSLYLKCALEWHGANWTILFFPCELGYFLLGALGCRAYERFLRPIASNILTVIPAIILSSAILYISIIWFKIPYTFHNGFTLSDAYKRLAYMVMIAVSLPFIFKASSQSQIDKAIGEISYPIYLSHLLIIEMLTYFKFPLGNIAILAGTIAIAISIPIAKYIEKPITAYRHRRFLKQSLGYPQDVQTVSTKPSGLNSILSTSSRSAFGMQVSARSPPI